MNYKIDRNESCWCGSGKKYKVCHLELDDRIRDYKRRGYLVPDKKLIKSDIQIAGIRESGKINTEILDFIANQLKIGMSTAEIDYLIYHKTVSLGGYPAPLGFEGFPKSVCTSINHEVCHGIPSEQSILKDGDIINIDVSTLVKGYYSDSSRMFCVGSVSLERMKLVEAAREAINRGLEYAKPWNFLGDIGQAINDYAISLGYSVVKEIGGHGIGLEFHEEPYVSYVSKRGTDMLLVPGMVFTIEPMINAGKASIVQDDKNGWTIRTKDGKDSAQWEVTILITDSGYEILAY